MNSKLTTRDEKLAAARARREAARGNGHFDITETVGRVHYGPDYEGGETVRQATFRIIADLDRDGDFNFPNPDGTTTTVSISTTSQEISHA